MIRIFQATSLHKNRDIELNESASHHLSKVLRVQKNDQVTLFNGQGGEYLGFVSNINKKIVTVKLTEFVNRESESSLNISLAQGISRTEKMDLVIQKSVELGIKKIIPIIAERTQFHWDAERIEKKMKHWQSIMISACEQCGRNQLPELASPIFSLDWLKKLDTQAMTCLTLSPQARQNLKSLTLSVNKPILFFIGPEGGLTDKEIQDARNKNFIEINLGPRILRTETAAIAAVAATQAFFGDM